MQKNKFNQSIEDINDFFSLLEFIDAEFNLQMQQNSD